jgi:hypothetical protein
VDVTIQSKGGTGAGFSKTMTMLVADRRATTLTAQARATTLTAPFDPRRLNGTVTAGLLRDGKIDMSLNLDIDVSDVSEGAESDKERAGTIYRGILNFVLDSGKPMLVSKSADPLSDRTVTVEVKATLLK